MKQYKLFHHVKLKINEKINLIKLFAAIYLQIPHTGKAVVKLPAIISSNIVLQHNTNVRLWGWADTNEKFTIETSWLSEIKTIEAAK